MIKIDREELERLYVKYTRKEYAHPDPVEFLFAYENPEDIEIVGLIASSFAYGRVSQILKSVSAVLDIIGKRPLKFLLNATVEQIGKKFSGFKYRFTTGEEIASLLVALKSVYERYDGMFSFFIDFDPLTVGETCDTRLKDTIYPYLVSFVSRLKRLGGISKSSLIPEPTRMSACKRLNLFFRWMIREDEIDFGIWNRFPQSKLLVPLDTHMHKVGRNFGFTNRFSSSIITAWEITEGFKAISPDDPVRYDFALTRPGILNEEGLKEYLEG